MAARRRARSASDPARRRRRGCCRSSSGAPTPARWWARPPTATSRPRCRGWRSATPGRRASAQRTGVNAESKLLLLAHAFEVLGCRGEFRTHWRHRRALDVFPRARRGRRPVRVRAARAENVILTPHIAGSTEEAQQDIGVRRRQADRLHGAGRRRCGTCPVQMPRQPGLRLLVLHRNQPGVPASTACWPSTGSTSSSRCCRPRRVGSPSPTCRRGRPTCRGARQMPRRSGRRAPAVAGSAPRTLGRVRRRRPAADRCRRAARAGGRPGAAHPAHRRQGRRARGDGRRAGRAHRRGAGRQRRRRRGRRAPTAPRSRCSTGCGWTPAGWPGSPTRCAQLVALPDPVGDVVRGSRLPNGLQLRQVRVPLGVVGIVYEARPNVTVDAAGLCLKSGNAALLRGSASAFGTNTALVAVLTEAGDEGRAAGRASSSCCRPTARRSASC